MLGTERIEDARFNDHRVFGCEQERPLGRKFFAVRRPTRACIRRCQVVTERENRSSFLETESPATMRISHVKPKFELLLKQQPGARTFRRQRMNDDEVITFIQTSLAESPGRSCSALLAALRRSDHACEQSRFRKKLHWCRGYCRHPN
jgi:hypothetical protein